MRLRVKKTGKVINAFFVLHEDDNPHEITFGTVEDITNNYEDYKPAEPLIKDEKIRKTVRAWAEINQFGAEYVVKYYMNNFSLTSWQANIEFNSHIKDLEDGKEYTIAALCGEDDND